jgi:hypothetical protein
MCFFILKIYFLFGYIEEFLMDVSFHHVDMGEKHLVEIPTLGHRKDAQIAIDHEVATGGLWEVETNLCGLTMGVPPLRR